MMYIVVTKIIDATLLCNRCYVRNPMVLTYIYVYTPRYHPCEYYLYTADSYKY